jgi:hypothetical protein
MLVRFRQNGPAGQGACAHRRVAARGLLLLFALWLGLAPAFAAFAACHAAAGPHSGLAMAQAPQASAADCHRPPASADAFDCCVLGCLTMPALWPTPTGAEPTMSGALPQAGQRSWPDHAPPPAKPPPRQPGIL